MRNLMNNNSRSSSKFKIKERISSKTSNSTKNLYYLKINYTLSIFILMIF